MTFKGLSPENSVNFSYFIQTTYQAHWNITDLTTKNLNNKRIQIAVNRRHLNYFLILSCILFTGKKKYSFLPPPVAKVKTSESVPPLPHTIIVLCLINDARDFGVIRIPCHVNLSCYVATCLITQYNQAATLSTSTYIIYLTPPTCFALSAIFRNNIC